MLTRAPQRADALSNPSEAARQDGQRRNQDATRALEDRRPGKTRRLVCLVVRSIKHDGVVDAEDASHTSQDPAAEHGRDLQLALDAHLQLPNTKDGEGEHEHVQHQIQGGGDDERALLVYARAGQPRDPALLARSAAEGRHEDACGVEACVDRHGGPGEIGHEVFVACGEDGFELQEDGVLDECCAEAVQDFGDVEALEGWFSVR